MAIGFWAIDVVMAGRWGNYASAHNTKTLDACDLEWSGREGLETLDEPPGRVRVRHPVAPRRPRGRLARDQSGDARVLHRHLAAGVTCDRRPAGGPRGRVDSWRRRRRDGPDGEPLPVPLHERAVPRLGHHDDRALVHPDVARHRQPASARRGRRDGLHGQLDLEVRPAGDHARLRDAEPRQRRHDAGPGDRGGRRSGATSALPRRGDGADVEARRALQGHPRGLEDLLRLGGRPVCVGLAAGLRLRDGVPQERQGDQRQVSGDPAGGRDPQGLRPSRLRPARRGAPRRRTRSQGESRGALHDLPLGLRHLRERRAGGRPGRRAVPRRRQGGLVNRSVNAFIKSLRENDYDASRFVDPGKTFGNVPNVWAELGSVWREHISDPNAGAHLLGKLITHVGPKRIAWGTDSLWYGSPHREIIALRKLEFTNEAKELYNLPYGLDGDVEDPTQPAPSPERTIRNGILGRNAAAAYNIDPDLQRARIECDDVNALRKSDYLKDVGELTESAPLRENKMHGGANAARGLEGTQGGAVGTMRIGRLVVIAVAAVALFAPAGSAQAATCGARPDHAGGEWPFYSGTLDGHREQLQESDDRCRKRLAARRRLEADDAGQRRDPLDPGGRRRLRVHRHRPRQRLRPERGHRRGRLGAVARRAASGSSIATARASSGRRPWPTGWSTWRRPRRRRRCCPRSTRRPARSSGRASIDEDRAAGSTRARCRSTGMVFQAFKGDESSNHSNPGFAIVDGSREGGGEILVKTPQHPGGGLRGRRPRQLDRQHPGRRPRDAS